MRVAVHVGQLLQPLPGGIGRYVECLVVHLGRAGVTVVPFAAGPQPDGLPPATEPYRDLGWPRGRWRYELWHRVRRPRVAGDADVVHAPSLAVPPTGRVPLVVTVHDLAFLRYPDAFTRRGVRFHTRGLELARREAAAVVVPSRFVGEELADQGFAPERVFVAPHGADAPPEADDRGDPTRRRDLGVNEPYVLFVGTVEPRKGVPALLAAFAGLRAGHPDLSLVVAGWRGWGRVDGLDAAGVVRTGPVGGEDLDALYRGAALLAYPSRYEGFGLPVLEAMARGCPVVTSAAASLPEVAGDAAVLVDPDDPDALAAGIESLLDDPDRRRDLADRGRRRALRFTWTACVEQHVAAYRAAVGP